jgi:hypothetical protein
VSDVFVPACGAWVGDYPYLDKVRAGGGGGWGGCSTLLLLIMMTLMGVTVMVVYGYACGRAVGAVVGGVVVEWHG